MGQGGGEYGLDGKADPGSHRVFCENRATEFSAKTRGR